MAEITDKQKLDIALQALEEMQHASIMLASRTALSVTAKKIQGKNESADLEERTFLIPWEQAAEKAKAAILLLKEEQ